MTCYQLWALIQSLPYWVLLNRTDDAHPFLTKCLWSANGIQMYRSMKIFYKLWVISRNAKVKSESESRSVVSDSLWSRGLYSPWNSPGQNTGVGSRCLLQGNLLNPGIEPTSPTLQADSLPAEPPGKPKNTGMGSPIPSPGNIPNPGIEPGSSALQVDSLPAEQPRKPCL